MRKQEHRMSTSLLSMVLSVIAVSVIGGCRDSIGAADPQLRGQVLGAGAPIAGSTVTLWAAGPGQPKLLGQTRTDANGRFSITPSGTPEDNASVYVIAKGGRA